jgi:hypothetical protein
MFFKSGKAGAIGIFLFKSPASGEASRGWNFIELLRNKLRFT